MQIHNITTALRPRNHWETLDLGFNMAQKWFLPLFLLWFIPALPFFILFHSLPFISNTWAILILWWFKPLFEQALLFYISRALFGEYPSIRQVLSQYWSISKPQLFKQLTWRRLSFSRSFNNPIAMLEGLNDEERIKRIKVLHYSQRNMSQWLHIFCYHFEAIIYIAILAFCIMLIPEEVEFTGFDFFSEEEDSIWGVLNNFIYFIAMGVIAPFYVCAGFSLYLTRRTELEAWDIELSFKRIADRLKNKFSVSASVFLVFTLGLSTFSPNDAYAIEQQESKELIQEVLEKEEFGEKKTVKSWQAIDKEKELKEDDSDFKWLGDLIEALVDWFSWTGDVMPNVAALLEFSLWVLVIALVVYLISQYTNWLEVIGLSKSHKKKQYVPPTELFGLKVDAESLPDDVVAEVRRFLKDGKIRQGLSLLYRATLIQLIHLHEIEIEDSNTEGECQYLVKQSRPQEESEFFSSLTRQWLLFAYAHEKPNVEKLYALCDTWPKYYQVQHGDE